MTKILQEREYYKPLTYPWALEAWQAQQTMHWLPEEVPMKEDVSDWKNKLTDKERNLLTQIFRFFVQGDVDVANGYLDTYIPLFKCPEIRMMMSAFANMETVHVVAYAQLIETVGMPEAEYKAFKDYKEMADKHEYIANFKPIDKSLIENEWHRKQIAKSLAVYSAFTEGLQLFSSFAILLNFTRFGKMKGMGQIVTWSIRDESLHVNSMIKVFTTYIEENLDIWTDELKKEIYDICRKMVDLEDKFIDLAFEQGGIQGLTPEEVKQYVRYVADTRLLQLGLKPNFKVKDNPLPWLADMLNSVEHGNFFETRVTEYNRVALTGSWDDLWESK